MPTARPFAYNTGASIAGTEQVGNLAVGYPSSGFGSTGVSWWNGPDEDLGYVIAASVPGGNQPTPDGLGASVGFWRSGSLTEQSFVDLTNGIFGQSFSDGASAKTYLNTNGYWTSFGLSTLLLDLYPNAALAYSLRKLRTAYSGSAIRVRRSFDDAEQDIGFSSNDLDTAGLIDFIGYNITTYSEDISQTSTYGYVGLNTTGTPPYLNVITAPDNTLSGDKIIESTASSTHLLNKTGGVTAVIGADYNLSLYLKQGERTSVRFESALPGTTQACVINLIDGTISGSNFTNSPVISAESNGWYRFSVKITAGQTSTSQCFRIYLRAANGELSYTGDGTSGAYAWGFQLSKTADLKAYQKTLASAGGGFVTTWYDQSTNSNNSTQATAADQAQIVSGGSIVTDPNTGKITTTWVNDSYSLASGISPNTRYLSVGVVNRTSNTINIGSLGLGAIGGIQGQQPLYWQATTGRLRSDMSSLVSHGFDVNVGAFIITSEKNSSDLKTAYVNGSALATTATQIPADGANFIYFGRTGSGTTSGRYAEYIYWDSDQSANRTGIESNINTYWDVY
jgi:hypothetical protein